MAVIVLMSLKSSGGPTVAGNSGFRVAKTPRRLGAPSLHCSAGMLVCRSVYYCHLGVLPEVLRVAADVQVVVELIVTEVGGNTVDTVQDDNCG